MVHVVKGSLWVYAPTKGVSIVFAVLFAISCCLHIWQNNIKFKSWRIGFLLPWAALLFVAGFSLREYGAYHYDNLDIFIASTVLLFLAPPVYNGANYFIFGRILYYLPYLSPLHPGRVWTTFIALDTIDGIIAGNGAANASNASNSESKIKSGIILVKVSLFLLLGMFLGFMILIIIFHRRAVAAGVFTYKTKIIIYELYVSCFLILIRNVFRTAAFFYPPDSIANGDEVLFWVLEALPMLVNSYLMNVYPPAKYLPANHKIYLAVDGKTEIEGPGMVDKRPFLLTFFDPFDLTGLISGQDNKNKFWEKDGIGGPLPAVRGDETEIMRTTEEGQVKT
ncbi:uncharacterized protein Z518_04139 [Rhinocladiella mackenziei CBS 650.93]|uniref:Rhinocladiella mackenziei CBS 650.93 unplaced genomic scaffold supercont1.3, whole genome shotgun sequence n=1 Tax=Rhinocladiella mackenziei CBS 650.93 TaxID=1442369 RepID=A0A0D2JAM5_9EURO|nr:uncharacterized protein Z518_04139 [Rhinocladiella mackenziei CBS 650.93]KIX06165.1 hypothetical protein Z518_04139 [Rhinocladiella mackenziei CBS 650.93]